MWCIVSPPHSSVLQVGWSTARDYYTFLWCPVPEDHTEGTAIHRAVVFQGGIWDHWLRRGFIQLQHFFLTACQEAWPLRELLRLLYQHSKIWNSTHFNGISCLVLTRSFSLCSMRSLLIDRLGLGTRKGIWLLKVETEILSICFMF